MLAPITDGTVDDIPAVVGLAQTADPAETPYCTGTLIAPTMVATAAHCVTDEGPAYVAIGGAHVEVAMSERAATFDPLGLVDDVAVVYLARAADVAPMPIADARALDVGAMVRIVGYGRTSADQPADGVLRAGDAMVTELGARDFVIAPAPSQTCFGDSGGPALVTVDGRDALAGIASSGDTACSMHARFIRTDPFTGDLLDTENRITGGCNATRPDAGSFATAVLVLLLTTHRRSRC